MKVGRFYGIDVHVHWSFWLLIAIYLVSVARSGGLAEGLIAVTFILSVFLCVLLHEYGHAIAARRFGIRTLDITLMPIGGLARLERMPDKPMQEFYVAIAGPLVNVAIAGVLFLVKTLDVITAPAAPTVEFGSNFVGAVDGGQCRACAVQHVTCLPHGWWPRPAKPLSDQAWSNAGDFDRSACGSMDGTGLCHLGHLCGLEPHVAATRWIHFHHRNY